MGHGTTGRFGPKFEQMLQAHPVRLELGQAHWQHKLVVPDGEWIAFTEDAQPHKCPQVAFRGRVSGIQVNPVRFICV